MLKIYVEKRKVEKDGKEISLPPIAFNLLLLLARNKGKVLSRNQILDGAWEYRFVKHRTVDIQIHRLKNLIGDGIIEGVLKAGYRMKEDVDVVIIEPSSIKINPTYEISEGFYVTDDNKPVYVTDVVSGEEGIFVIFKVFPDNTSKILRLSSFKLKYKSIKKEEYEDNR